MKILNAIGPSIKYYIVRKGAPAAPPFKAPTP